MDEGGSDRAEALTLCEHALALISKANDWTALESGSRIGHWSNRRFHAALLVPPDTTIEGACMPHVLELWDGDDKVLSACWEDPQQLEVRVLKAGEWQPELLAA